MPGFITKDSGERVKYFTGMVRDSQAGKPRYDLIYEPLFTEWANLMARGAEKYADEVEEWRDSSIPNVQVSNMGNVKKNGKYIKPWINKWGYKLVTLNGKRKHYQVHRLVAETFIGKSKLHVNHIDFDKLNNRIDNLEYLTQKENVRHSAKNGRMNGIQNAKCKINFNIAQEIRNRISSGEKSKDLAKEFSVSPQTICDIIKYRVWKEDLTIKRDLDSENWKRASTVAELKRFKASAWRHFVQFIRGDDDEAHHAAVCFNISAIMYLMNKMNVDINGNKKEI